MKKIFTISIYSENTIGTLNRVTTCFIRKHVNIESITGSESEITGIYRFTITVNEELTTVQKLIKHIEKQIEVFRAFYHEEEGITHIQVALFKIKKEFYETDSFSALEQTYNAKCLKKKDDFVILSCTDVKEKLQEFSSILRNKKVLLQFVRSGRISVSYEAMEVSKLLLEQV